MRGLFLLFFCCFPGITGIGIRGIPSAAGIVSVVSNLLPSEAVRLCSASPEKADALQERMQPLIRALFSETNPAPVKAALNLMGLCGDEVRLPLVRVQPGTLEKLRRLLPVGVNA